MAENITQKDLANGDSCCLGGCIIGVSGADSLCVHALGLCMYVGGIVGRNSVYACINAFTAAHTDAKSCCVSEVQSFYDRVRDCDLFLMKENVGH